MTAQEMKRIKVQPEQMVQVGVTFNGEYQVITVSLSTITGLFTVNVQPTNKLEVCEGTQIMHFNKKCKLENVYTEPIEE
jgi:hypothetical protein